MELRGIADFRLPIADWCLIERSTLLVEKLLWRFFKSPISNRKSAFQMRHTLSIIVADQPGELSRIVGLFSARGFNIETISVGETLDPHWSRVTIVTGGEDRTIQQIVKQCERLARVREVQDVTTRPHIEREMALI